MPLSKPLLLLFTFLLSTMIIRAQPFKNNTPLHQYFQRQFDSTLIYYHWSEGAGYLPNYYIMARKENRTFYFRYTSPYKEVQGQGLPEDIASRFIREHVQFALTVPDTNQYLVPVRVNDATNGNWEQVRAYGLWQWESVGAKEKECAVYDAAYETYYLISKKKTKTLEYYGVDDEKCGPSDLYHSKEMLIRNFIRMLFKD